MLNIKSLHFILYYLLITLLLLLTKLILFIELIPAPQRRSH